MKKVLKDSIPYVTKRVIESNYYYEIWSDGIIKFSATTDVFMTNKGYVELSRPSILVGKKIKRITVTNVYVSTSISINATVIAQDNDDGKIVFYFRIGNQPITDFKAKLMYEIVVY